MRQCILVIILAICYIILGALELNGVRSGVSFTTIQYFAIYVTGSGKRDIFTQTMIFQYKRCCSKKRNITFLNFFWLNGIYNSLPTLTPNFSN